MRYVKIYVLMETDTDTAYPIVSVYTDREQAIQTALMDIKGNQNVVIEVDEKDERYEGRDVWSCMHRSSLNGTDQWSTITRFEVGV